MCLYPTSLSVIGMMTIITKVPRAPLTLQQCIITHVTISRRSLLECLINQTSKALGMPVTTPTVVIYCPPCCPLNAKASLPHNREMRRGGFTIASQGPKGLSHVTLDMTQAARNVVQCPLQASSTVENHCVFPTAAWARYAYILPSSLVIGDGYYTAGSLLPSTRAMQPVLVYLIQSYQPGIATSPPSLQVPTRSDSIPA